MVNPGPSMRQLRLQESREKNRSKKVRPQPNDIREGVVSAFMLVKEVSIFLFFFFIYIIYLLNAKFKLIFIIRQQSFCSFKKFCMNIFDITFLDNKQLKH